MFLEIIIILFLLILIIYSLFREPFNVCLERKTIFLEKLPANFSELKIIQISDLHSKGFGKREKRVLQIIKQQKADFIFITGDINEAYSNKIDSCSKFWKALGRLKGGNVYCVFGNHIYEHQKIEPVILRNILEKSGIQVLNNENVKLKRGKEYIWLLGVNDPHTNHHNLSKALDGIDDSSIKILLSHSPEIIDDIKVGDANLILAGHTHGGQIKIPGIRPFWVPTKYHGKYQRGLFKIRGIYLYVNRGIGTAHFPVRFNSIPEVTLFTLRKHF